MLERFRPAAARSRPVALWLAALLVVGLPAAADAPLVTIDSPPDGFFTPRDSLTVRVSFAAQPADGNVSQVDLLLEGVPVGSRTNSRKIKAATVAFLVDLAGLPDGPAVLTARAFEGNPQDGVVGESTITLFIDRTPPVLTLTEPAPGTATEAATITVSGIVSEPAQVTVDGFDTGLADPFFSVGVPLSEGAHLLAVAATDAAGNTGTAAVTVTRDTQPPRLTVLSPAAGTPVQAGTVRVSGLVADATTVTVSVHGVEAQVDGGAFTADGVPVARGAGSLTAVATDALGHTTPAVVPLLGDPTPKARILAETGDGQQGAAGSPLPLPFTVRLEDGAGAPVAGVPVSFTVERGGGSFDNGSRQRQAITGIDGRASTGFTLGRRAGAASDRVGATAPAFFGAAVFTASATPAPGTRVLAAEGGNFQTGEAGRLAPRPVSVRLTDGAGNPLAGAAVTLTVLAGGGRVANQSAATLTTDADGRASALWVLGLDPGASSQIVEAASAGAVPLRFLGSAVTAGDPASTAVSGVVLTEENLPVAGVAVTLEETAQSTLTDSAGRFRIAGVPAGRVHLLADGVTAGDFAALRLPAELIAGLDNALPRPIYLTPLDTSGQGPAGPDAPLTLERVDTPGLVLRVAAGAVTLPGGSGSGVVALGRAHRDKLPAAPAGGAPRLALSVQPAGIAFDPPAPLTLPNLEGWPRGEVVDLLAWDEEQGSFTAAGTLRVSEDGTRLETEADQGLRRGGWFAAAAEDGGRTCVAGACVRVRCDASFLCLKCSADFTAGGVCAGATVADACRPLDPADPADQAALDLAAVTGTPDADCYAPCSDATACDTGSCAAAAPAEVLPGEPTCVRGFDPGHGLGGLAGTCRVPSNATLPVCCPEAHWDPINRICCIEPVGNKGLCEAQGVTP